MQRPHVERWWTNAASGQSWAILVLFLSMGTTFLKEILHQEAYCTSSWSSCCSYSRDFSGISNLHPGVHGRQKSPRRSWSYEVLCHTVWCTPCLNTTQSHGVCYNPPIIVTSHKNMWKSKLIFGMRDQAFGFTFCESSPIEPSLGFLEGWLS